MLRILLILSAFIMLIIFIGCASSIQTQFIEDKTVTTVNKVWYRFEEEMKLFPAVAPQDSGVLILNDDSLEYIGKKYQVIMKDITKISFGKLVKKDNANDWVKIDYNDDQGNPHMAFFLDAGSMGWSGKMGGTLKMYDLIYQKYHKK